MIKSTQTLLSAEYIQNRLCSLAQQLTDDLGLIEIAEPRLTIVINQSSALVLGRAFGLECTRIGWSVETILLPSDCTPGWVLQQQWGDACLLFQDISSNGESLAQPLQELAKLLECPVKTCCIFQKRTLEKRGTPVDYLGFTIPNVFVVGCGLTDSADAIGPIEVVG